MISIYNKRRISLHVHVCSISSVSWSVHSSIKMFMFFPLLVWHFLSFKHAKCFNVFLYGRKLIIVSVKGVLLSYFHTHGIMYFHFYTFSNVHIVGSEADFDQGVLLFISLLFMSFDCEQTKSVIFCTNIVCLTTKSCLCV